jgi:hypothetical protein
MRKMYIDLKATLIVNVEEGKTLNDVIDNIEINVIDDDIEIIDATIENYYLTDVK